MQDITFITEKNHSVFSDKIEIVGQKEGFKRLRDYLSKKSASKDLEIAYDKETTSVDPFKAVQLLDAIGDSHKQFVIDMTSVNIESITSILDEFIILGHNIAYDYRVNETRKRYFNENVINISKVYDTMIVEQRLGLGSKRSNSLDDVYARRLGVNMKTSKETRKQFVGRGTNIVFTDEHIMYSAGDVEALPMIKEVQEKFIKKFRMEKLMNIEFNCLLPIALSSVLGMKLDREKWEEMISDNYRLKKELELEMDEILSKIGLNQPERKSITIEQGSLFGEDSFIVSNKNTKNVNYSSTKQVCNVIRSLQYPVPTAEEYKNGELVIKDSISEGSVEMYKYDYPNSPLLEFFDVLLKHKEIIKALNSFGRRFLVQTLSEKGKKTKTGYYRKESGNVHTLYRQCVTENGRLASGNEKEGYFNSQQIPKEKKYRQCFTVSNPDYYITTADLSSAEMVILGALSGDTRLLELVKDGDIHSTIASSAYTNVSKKIVKLYRNNRSELVKELTDILKPNKIYKSLGDISDSEKSNILNERITRAVKNDGLVVVNKETAKDMRDPFKNVIYGISYGATVKKISVTVRVREEYAQIILDTMKNELPRMFKFLEKSSEFGVKNGYILFNDTTNSRHWFEKALESKQYGIPLDFKIQGDIERQCKNYRISGTQADMVKEMIGEIDSYIKTNNVDATLRLTVHDELVYEHKDKEFGEVVSTIMKKVANRYLKGITEMDVDYETLKTWTK